MSSLYLAGRDLVGGASAVRRVLGALICRELVTRYGRHNIGFAWVFCEPMLFTLAIAALWTLTRSATSSGVPVAAFALTGYSSVLLWRNSASRCTQAISANWALLYHRKVTPLTLYLSRILIEVGAASASLLLLSLFFWAIGWIRPPEDLWGVLAAWLLLIGFSIALGLTVGSLATFSELAERLWHMLTYLLFPVSGAVFMVEWLPPTLRAKVLWLPMVHGVELLRGAWFGRQVHSHGDWRYLLACSLVLAIVGLSLVRWGGRSLETP